MTTTNKTTNELASLRARYRELQIASGLTPEWFRAKVDSLRSEIADGEEVSEAPRDILNAAMEVAFYHSSQLPVAGRRGNAR